MANPDATKKIMLAFTLAEMTKLTAKAKFLGYVTDKPPVGDVKRMLTDTALALIKG
jgi:hypothetical protein